MRRAIEVALGLARRGVDKLVLELPTGYGKTFAAPYLYRAFREAGLCWKAIHVFPLRTLLHRTLETYTRTWSDIGFTYQDGDVTFAKKGYVKDPYFTGEYVLTTMDSFIHNLFKAPVAELPRILKGRAVHYHVPSSYIYPSCVFFDEAHIAARGGEKAAAALDAALEALREAEIPVVVMSATLGEWKRGLFRDFEFVGLGPKDEGNVVHDPEFEGALRDTRYVVRTIDEGDVIDVALRELGEGRRVLIVVNNIRRAVEWYMALDVGGKALVHSQLTRRDRRAAEERLRDARIVVGTSAIEAGVDVTFDTLITSADAPESVAQRVGRICRYGARCEGRRYVFGERAETYMSVAEWRLPYGEHSYVNLLSRELKFDEGLRWALGQLHRLLYVEQHDLRRLFGKHGYSYVREYALVEVCTTPSYDPEHCFATSIDGIEFPVGVIEDGRVVDVERVDEEWLKDWVEQHGDFPVLYAKRYVPGVGPQ